MNELNVNESKSNVSKVALALVFLAVIAILFYVLKPKVTAAPGYLNATYTLDAGSTASTSVASTSTATGTPTFTGVSKPQVQAVPKKEITVTSPTGIVRGDIVVVGQIACLTYKSATTQPVDSCALGLKADNGLYYALDTMDINNQFMSDIKMTQYLKATGKFILLKDLNQYQYGMFNAVGLIEVHSLTTYK